MNNIILTISGHDILRPLGIYCGPFPSSVCDTKYYKWCVCVCEGGEGFRNMPPPKLLLDSFQMVPLNEIEIKYIDLGNHWFKTKLKTVRYTMFICILTLPGCVTKRYSIRPVPPTSVGYQVEVTKCYNF